MEATVTDDRLAGVPDLVSSLGALDLRLVDPGLESERGRVRSLMAGYLAPRSTSPDGPLVVGVVGASGSGKSTIINSLARHAVSPTGAIRPTTRQAIVWTAEPLPATLDELRAGGRIRVTTEGSGPPEGIIFVDTPPPEYSDGQSIAAAVLNSADACLLVTSGLRYADLGSWSLIRRAVRRQLPIVVVLNRLPEDPGLQETVAGDLARRLEEIGVASEPSGAPVVTVAEGPIVADTEGLPAEWVSRLRKEVDALADLQTRRAVIARTIAAARREVERGLLRLREALIDASLVHGELSSVAARAYEDETSRVVASLGRGGLAGPSAEALAADLAAVVAWHANLASRRTAEGWQATSVGERVLERRPDLWTHGAAMFETARGRFGDWNRGLGDLVLDTAAKRKMRGGRLARYVELVRSEAVDTEHRPGGRSARRRRSRLGDAPGVARGWLAKIATELLAADAARFSGALGPAPTGELLRGLVLPDG